MRNERPKLYALILQYLSEESQGMRQGAYESIITYKERFTVALKAAGSIKQPENLNAMYLLANQWLKTTTRNDPEGYATTFTTTLDHQERSNRRGKKQDKKQEKNSDSEKKEKKEKDMSKVECYACGAMGHYANKCPSRQQRTDSNENEEQEQEEARSSHVTWNANAFTTHQTYAVAQEGRFKPSEVLIDNQANISIVHPSLLRDVQRADHEVKINGVAAGGSH